MTTERTQGSAWKSLEKRRADLMKTVDDSIARHITEPMMKEIFDLEWASQFDDDRSEALHKINQIVNDRIEEMKLKGRST